MTIIDFRPAKSLIVPNQSGSARPNKLILFGNHWMDLQNYVQGALQFAPDIRTFTASYGDFGASDQALITGAVAALGGVQGLSAQFGNPAQLQKKIYANPMYLQAAAPPKEVYGHIAWVAGKIRVRARTFSDTFDVLIDALNEVAVADRPTVIRDILGGPNGLIPIATASKAETGDLLTNLAQFERALLPHNAALAEYTANSSRLLTTAKNNVKDYEAKISELRELAEDANRRYLAFAIAAGAVGAASVVTAGFFFFPPALLIGGLGVAGLATAAALQKRRYNELMESLGGTEAEKTKKSRLVTDLEGFNPKVLTVADSLGQFMNSLREIHEVWDDISRKLNDIVNNYTDAQILQLPYPEQVTNVRAAVEEWNAISNAAGDFTSKSLINYDTNMRFGQKLVA